MSLIVTKFCLLNERVLKYEIDFSVQKVIRPIIKVSLSMIIDMIFLLKVANLVVWNTYWSPGLTLGENWCACAVHVVNMNYIVLGSVLQAKIQRTELSDYSVEQFDGTQN
jgi:hypothetical protein